MKRSIKTVPASPQHILLMKAPTVDSQLPIDFQKGSRFLELTADCPGCDIKYDASRMLGIVTRPIEAVVVIDGVCICPRCKVLMPFRCRVRDDLSVEWVDHTGKWCRSDNNVTRTMGDTSDRSTMTIPLFKSLALWWGLFLTLMFPMVVALFRFAKMGV